MIDDLFLINIHQIFVMLRSEITHASNVEALCLIRDNLRAKGLNDELLNGVQKSSQALKDHIYDILEDGEASGVDIEHRDEETLSIIFEAIINLLQEGSFEQAHDLVDAFHVFPELIAIYKGKIDHADYFNIYINPLKAKWGEEPCCKAIVERFLQ